MVGASILDLQHSRDADPWWLDRNGVVPTLILSTPPCPEKRWDQNKGTKWRLPKKRDFSEGLSLLFLRVGEENNGQ